MYSGLDICIEKVIVSAINQIFLYQEIYSKAMSK